MKKENLIALIYCRVSSMKQVKEGKGLDGQEHRCVEWARLKKFPVEKIFREDESASGRFFERPAMKKLIQYLDENQDKKFVIIFDDLKRFARDVPVHYLLKKELIEKRGAILECLNFKFEDSPEGNFIELIMAGQAQLEREQNTRQVKQKMKARLERGYWAFCPPPALINNKDSVHGKILVSKEPLASIFKQAIEGYAQNILNTQEEVRQFIMRKYQEQGINRPISKHGVERILKNPLYAGLIEYPDWDVPLMDAQHEGFISKETFEAVQEKLLDRSKPRSGKCYNPDFPLRQFITCAACGKKLYASWNGNRDGSKSPNYYCSSSKHDCVFGGKVTKAYDIHPKFETVLQSAKIESHCFEIAKSVFEIVWENKEEEWRDLNKSKAYKRRDVEKSISSLVEKISAAKSNALVVAYENKIEELSEQLEDLGDNQPTNTKFNKKGLNKCWSQVEEQLKNPLLLWNSDKHDNKRTVLHMYFNNGLSWHYENGFGAVKISDEIKLLQSMDTGNLEDVEMAGIEPASATV